jgi:acyl-CoA thioesterase I
VLFLGTSLTDGYGLEREEAYPALVQQRIDDAGLAWEVVNAGVSGEKSAGALQRLRSWLIRQPFDVLVVETGANDMLQGADLDTLNANLEAIIETVRERRPGTRVVLVGMRAAPNLGRPYVERFDGIFPALAAEHDLVLVPFLLDGVAGERDLNLADGIHPNARGHRRLAETVWATLEPILREEERPAAGGG